MVLVRRFRVLIGIAAVIGVVAFAVHAAAQAPAPGQYISWAPPASATATSGRRPGHPDRECATGRRVRSARWSDLAAFGAVQAVERQHRIDCEGRILDSAEPRRRARDADPAVPELGHGRTMSAGRSESRGATSNSARRIAPGRPPQRRDHRPRRPRQDHARRCPAEAIARLRGPRAGRRVDHGFQRPRAREGDHHPREDHLGPLQRGEAQHHRHPGTRGLRRRGRARPRAWPTDACSSSTPPRGRCPRRASCSARRSRSACSRSSS